MHYIGLDAHSKTCTWVAVDSSGTVVQSLQIPTTEAQLFKSLESIAGKKALAFEETHLSRWLYALLKDQVDELVVCNPSFVVRRTGSKNDFNDALHLAQQLRGGFLTPVFHEDCFYSDLRDAVHEHESVTRDLVRLKNRYKALFRSEAIPTDETDFYQDSKRIRELESPVKRIVCKNLFEQIQNTQTVKARYVEYFKELSQEKPEIKLLTSIPGISHTRASMIAATVVSPHRFVNKHKFWSYCMLVSHKKQSDGKEYGRQFKYGNTLLKNIFMGAAETNIMRGDELRAFYDAMRARGLEHSAAKKNLARKIAAIALSILKKGKEYNRKDVKKHVNTLH